MVYRIEITAKVFDTRATVLLHKLSSLPLSHSITHVSVVDVYTINKAFSETGLRRIGEMLANPVVQEFRIHSSKKNGKDSIASLQNDKKFSFAIETGFLPGVTDNVAHTTKEGIEDLLKKSFMGNEGVYVSQLLLLSGSLTARDAERVAASLINPLIQRVHIKSSKQFILDGGMDFIVPQVQLTASNEVTEVNLTVPDKELITIGKQGVANADGTRRGPLALDVLYMQTIQAYFKKLKRNPTDIELESIAQTWSEHCKHTIFADPIDEVKKGLYKTYIKGATEKIRSAKGPSPSGRDICVSVFSDNSGAITFDEKYVVTHKVETHNSPSALDPFGGAITGIVGVNRDTIGFGLGAKPVANFYGFCVADPSDTKQLYRDAKLTQPMLSPKRILEGVIAGVNSGGNCSGIPTPQGFLYFDKRYKGKPLVFAGTVGIIPRTSKGQPSYKKQAKPGDFIVMIGGRVGKDGIHGATFSSVALDSGSPAAAVQIGDPITQKKFSDAIVKEARDKGLFSSITDNGAGGLSCSVSEMARESNGCTVSLEKVPLKYPGLAPWEIWISESQERMTVAVPKKQWKKFADLMKRRGVEATIIGEFTSSGKCIVTYNAKKIFDLDLAFLHDGLPRRQQKTTAVKNTYKHPEIVQRKDLTNEVLKLMRRLNLASYAFVSSQYDHEVQDNSVLKPLIGRGRINADASIIRPILSSEKGVVLTQALYPTYSEIDPYGMSVATIDSAIRQAVVSGVNIEKLALLDNFCWCSSNDPKRLWQLKQAVKGCYEGAVAYGMPFISGKDSMFNDFNGYDSQGKPINISIPPTLLISAIGIIDSIDNAVTFDLKFSGDLIYILGETFDEIGGSEYAQMLAEKKGEKYIGRNIPKVDMKKNKKLYDKYRICLEKNLIASGISVGRGGLITSLIRSSMAGMLGVSISLETLPGKITQNEYALFSESQGRILVSVNPKNKKDFEKVMQGISFAQIGNVKETTEFTISGLHGKNIVTTDVDTLLHAYKERFKDW